MIIEARVKNELLFSATLVKSFEVATVKENNWLDVVYEDNYRSSMEIPYTKDQVKFTRILNHVSSD